MRSAIAGKVRAHPQAGFTLLELLIAMTLLGLLTAMLAAGMRTGTRVWERGASLASDMEDVGLAQDFLRRSLGAAYPLLLTKDRPRPSIDFEGHADAITFLGPAPIALAPGGRARIILRAVAKGDRVDLTMTVRPELGRTPSEAKARPNVLLTGLAGVIFRYFGVTSREATAEWQERWIERTELPQLIRVEVRFPPGDQRHWPDLLVAPRIFTDVACGYDPLTKRCQGR